jgi:CheY-like chemotaxis protein
VVKTEKPSLLIVEDDYENQRFLRLLLSRKFSVELCDSAETFYEKLSEKKFDLILMDISLKGEKDGLQLTKELRNSNEYLNIIIVVLSAHVFQKDKDNAYRAGVDLFIPKPVQNEVLLNSLTNIYESRTKIKLS